MRLSFSGKQQKSILFIIAVLLHSLSSSIPLSISAIFIVLYLTVLSKSNQKHGDCHLSVFSLPLFYQFQVTQILTATLSFVLCLFYFPFMMLLFEYAAVSPSSWNEEAQSWIPTLPHNMLDYNCSLNPYMHRLQPYLDGKQIFFAAFSLLSSSFPKDLLNPGSHIISSRMLILPLIFRLKIPPIV